LKSITKSTINDKERFDFVRWLIDSYDERKASVAGRATILLNADALLLAATTFLIDKLRAMTGQLSLTEQLILIISIALSLIFLVLSIAVATNGMANIWKTSTQKFGTEAPQRLYFYPRQTFNTFKTFSSFLNSFQEISEKQLTEYALAHLWVITREYKERYQNLRRATHFLVFAIFPLVFSIAFVLYKSI
jgi:hypothetical protein